MNILLISASPRAGLTLRFSLFLAAYLTEKYPKASVHRMDFTGFDISPLGKGLFPAEPVTPFQQELLENWKKADLIIFCSPEYNWTASAETFILMERLGSRAFRSFFEDKVFALAGVSSGRGGRQPALDIGRVLSKIIGFMDVHSIVSSKILEVHDAGMNLNENALSLGNPVFETAVQAFSEYSIQLTSRWMAGRPASKAL